MTTISANASATVPAQTQAEDPARAVQRKRERNVLSVFWSALGASCSALLVFAMNSGLPVGRVFGLGVLAAGASALVGALLGFLFGLPRDIGSEQPKTPPSPAPTPPPGQQAVAADQAVVTPAAPAAGVNNNLLEISDWLTKIIVGAGLVGLKELVPWLGGIAEMVGNGVGLASHAPARLFGGSILAFYGCWGFIFVYIQTRTIISLLFASMQRSLRDVLGMEVRQAVKEEVQQNVVPQLEQTVSENALLARLYSADASAPSEVVARATRFLAEPANRGNGRVWLYLACAFGQQHASTDDQAVRSTLSNQAFEALQNAMRIDPSLKSVARGLMFPDDPQRLPGDDDLQTFAAEGRFRELVGRAAA